MTTTQQAIIAVLTTLLIGLLSFLAKQIYDLVRAKIQTWNEKISPQQLEAVMSMINSNIQAVKDTAAKNEGRFASFYTAKEIDREFALRDERTENLSEKIDDLKVTVNVRLDDLPEQLADKIEARLSKGKR